jgi:RNA polymerase sigma-70 factor (ECF subfamily)
LKGNTLFLAKKIDKKTDRELLDLYVATSENEYFIALFGRYAPLIYGVCLKYLKNADRAQNTVIQLFTSLLSKVPHSEFDVFRTWLYSAVRNHCLQILQNKEEREKTVSFGNAFTESDPVLHILNDKNFDENDSRHIALAECIKKLPVNQQVSIEKFFYGELSYQDIADETGFLLKDVKSCVQNGIRNLKICLEKSLK